MLLTTAFILGAFGSLHCAGMCGPLVLALPVNNHTTATLLLSRAAYNLGRILSYIVIGVFMGLLGHTLSLAGFQRWLSLAAGGALLVGLAVSRQRSPGTMAARVVAWLKSGFSQLLGRRSFASVVLLGVLNGFLPCGMVYAACAGAVATGSIPASIGYMTAFGLGTVPMMLGLGLAGPKLQWTLRHKMQRLVPASVALVAVLLILRGLALGIPYVSPGESASSSKMTCH